MTKLQLSLAIGDYDRTRPLLDGSVQIDGVNPVTIDSNPRGDFLSGVSTRRIRHLRAIALEFRRQDSHR